MSELYIWGDTEFLTFKEENYYNNVPFLLNYQIQIDQICISNQFALLLDESKKVYMINNSDIKDSVGKLQIIDDLSDIDSIYVSPSNECFAISSLGEVYTWTQENQQPNKLDQLSRVKKIGVQYYLNDLGQLLDRKNQQTIRQTNKLYIIDFSDEIENQTILLTDENEVFLLKNSNQLVKMEFKDKITKICSGFNTFAVINAKKQLFIWNINEDPTEQKIQGKCKDISIGLNHLVCLDEEQQLWVKGKNNKGQLGVGDYIDREEFHKQNVIQGNIGKVFCGKNCVFAIGKNISLKTQVRKSLLKTEFKYINEMDEIIEELRQNKKDMQDNNVKLKVYYDEIENLKQKIKKQSEIIVAQEKENSDVRKENKRLEKLNKELLQFKEKFDIGNTSDILVENEKLKIQVQELEHKLNLQFQNNSILKNVHNQNVINLMKDSAISPMHGFNQQSHFQEEQLKNEKFLKVTIIELENTLQQERKKSVGLEKELQNLKVQFEKEVVNELNELDQLNASLVNQVKAKDQEIIQLNQIISKERAEMNQLQQKIQYFESNYFSFNQNDQLNNKVSQSNTKLLQNQLANTDYLSPKQNQVIQNSNRSQGNQYFESSNKKIINTAEKIRNKDENEFSSKKIQDESVLVQSIQGLLTEIQSLKKTKDNQNLETNHGKQLNQVQKFNLQENRDQVIDLQARLDEKNQDISKLKEENEKQKSEILEQKAQIIKLKEKTLYLQTKIQVIEQKKEQYRQQVKQSNQMISNSQFKNQQLREVNLFDSGQIPQNEDKNDQEAENIFSNKKQLQKKLSDSQNKFYVPELTPQQKTLVERIKLMNQGQGKNTLENDSVAHHNQYQQFKSMLSSHRGSLSNHKQNSLGNLNQFIPNIPSLSSNKSNLLLSNYNQDDQYQISKTRYSNNNANANFDIQINQDSSDFNKLDQYKINFSSVTSPAQKKHNLQTFLSSGNQQGSSLYQNYNNSAFKFTSEFNSPKTNNMMRPSNQSAIQYSTTQTNFYKSENKIPVDDFSQSQFLQGDDTSRMLKQKKINGYLIQQQYTPAQQTNTTSTSPINNINFNPYHNFTETETSEETAKIQNKLENDIGNLKKLMSGLKVKTDQVLKEVLSDI
ncbi:hypothetical protein TTHERM_01277470 (macronuclear) [Tetrahymena thermophila SB210]|uniref:Uncharacterized protein n=1 Tax=Tetrahymena thermophila (strain SB210) TaxID=312017 RepID=Q22A61_TETTS|nr:hypothetical protein TTHERM_01277470 [Tetrahymena thermophila SB210]EAR82171.2 hypothetical protein TTHERM_01277470 [Tetrahymena thermophila SB210]|eukprot:XP_001029834.2 hypothetical protein TTHERM_01277470 [Tetrahymena thermophila SB210]